MSTFFQQTAQAMIAKHIDRFPLLKLDQVIDWQPIEQYLNRQRTRYLRSSPASKQSSSPPPSTHPIPPLPARPQTKPRVVPIHTAVVAPSSRPQHRWSAVPLSHQERAAPPPRCLFLHKKTGEWANLTNRPKPRSTSSPESVSILQGAVHIRDVFRFSPLARGFNKRPLLSFNLI